MTYRTFCTRIIESDEFVDYGPVRVIQSENIALQLKHAGIRYKVETPPKQPFPHIFIHKDDVSKLKVKKETIEYGTSSADSVTSPVLYV